MAKFKIGDRIRVVTTESIVDGVRRKRSSLKVGAIYTVSAVHKNTGWNHAGAPAGADGAYALADHENADFFYEGALFSLADDAPPAVDQAIYGDGDIVTIQVTVKIAHADGSLTIIHPDGDERALSRDYVRKNVMLKEKAPKPVIQPEVGKKIAWGAKGTWFTILWMDKTTLLIQAEGGEPTVRTLEELPKWEVK